MDSLKKRTSRFKSFKSKFKKLISHDEHHKQTFDEDSSATSSSDYSPGKKGKAPVKSRQKRSPVVRSGPLLFSDGSPTASPEFKHVRGRSSSSSSSSDSSRRHSPAKISDNRVSSESSSSSSGRAKDFSPKRPSGASSSHLLRNNVGKVSSPSRVVEHSREDEFGKPGPSSPAVRGRMSNVGGDDSSGPLSPATLKPALAASINPEESLTISPAPNLQDKGIGLSPLLQFQRSSSKSPLFDYVAGQATCPNCDWVYPNPHPTSRQQREHRKQCGGILNVQVWFGKKLDESNPESETKTPATVGDDGKDQNVKMEDSKEQAVSMGYELTETRADVGAKSGQTTDKSYNAEEGEETRESDSMLLNADVGGKEETGNEVASLDGNAVSQPEAGKESHITITRETDIEYGGGTESEAGIGDGSLRKASVVSGGITEKGIDLQDNSAWANTVNEPNKLSAVEADEVSAQIDENKKFGSQFNSGHAPEEGVEVADGAEVDEACDMVTDVSQTEANVLHSSGREDCDDVEESHKFGNHVDGAQVAGYSRDIVAPKEIDGHDDSVHYSLMTNTAVNFQRTPIKEAIDGDAETTKPIDESRNFGSEVGVGMVAGENSKIETPEIGRDLDEDKVDGMPGVSMQHLSTRENPSDQVETAEPMEESRDFGGGVHGDESEAPPTAANLCENDGAEDTSATGRIPVQFEENPRREAIEDSRHFDGGVHGEESQAPPTAANLDKNDGAGDTSAMGRTTVQFEENPTREDHQEPMEERRHFDGGVHGEESQAPPTSGNLGKNDGADDTSAMGRTRVLIEENPTREDHRAEAAEFRNEKELGTGESGCRIEEISVPQELADSVANDNSVGANELRLPHGSQDSAVIEVGKSDPIAKSMDSFGSGISSIYVGQSRVIAPTVLLADLGKSSPVLTHRHGDDRGKGAKPEEVKVFRSGIDSFGIEEGNDSSLTLRDHHKGVDSRHDGVSWTVNEENEIQVTDELEKSLVSSAANSSGSLSIKSPSNAHIRGDDLAYRGVENNHVFQHGTVERVFTSQAKDEVTSETTIYRDYRLEHILRVQNTHDLMCPVCGSCITKRVILRKRKRTVILESVRATRPREEVSDELPAPTMEADAESEDEPWGCLACFSIFFRKVGRVRKRKEPEPTVLPSSEQQQSADEETSGREREDFRCLPLPLLLPAFPWGVSKFRRVSPELLEPLLNEPTDDIQRATEVPVHAEEEKGTSCLSYLGSIWKYPIYSPPDSPVQEPRVEHDGADSSLQQMQPLAAEQEPVLKEEAMKDPTEREIVETVEVLASTMHHDSAERKTGLNCLPLLLPTFSWGSRGYKLRFSSEEAQLSASQTLFDQSQSVSQGITQELIQDADHQTTIAAHDDFTRVTGDTDFYRQNLSTVVSSSPFLSQSEHFLSTSDSTQKQQGVSRAEEDAGEISEISDSVDTGETALKHGSLEKASLNCIPALLPQFSWSSSMKKNQELSKEGREVSIVPSEQLEGEVGSNWDASEVPILRLVEETTMTPEGMKTAGLNCLPVLLPTFSWRSAGKRPGETVFPTEDLKEGEVEKIPGAADTEEFKERVLVESTDYKDNQSLTSEADLAIGEDVGGRRLSLEDRETGDFNCLPVLLPTFSWGSSGRTVKVGKEDIKAVTETSTENKPVPIQEQQTIVESSKLKDSRQDDIIKEEDLLEKEGRLTPSVEPKTIQQQEDVAEPQAEASTMLSSEPSTTEGFIQHPEESSDLEVVKSETQTAENVVGTHFTGEIYAHDDEEVQDILEEGSAQKKADLNCLPILLPTFSWGTSLPKLVSAPEVGMEDSMAVAERVPLPAEEIVEELSLPGHVEKADLNCMQALCPTFSWLTSTEQKHVTISGKDDIEEGREATSQSIEYEEHPATMEPAEEGVSKVNLSDTMEQDDVLLERTYESKTYLEKAGLNCLPSVLPTFTWKRTIEKQEKETLKLVKDDLKKVIDDIIPSSEPDLEHHEVTSRPTSSITVSSEQPLQEPREHDILHTLFVKTRTEHYEREVASERSDCNCLPLVLPAFPWGSLRDGQELEEPLSQQQRTGGLMNLTASSDVETTHTDSTMASLPPGRSSPYGIANILLPLLQNREPAVGEKEKFEADKVDQETKELVEGKAEQHDKDYVHVDLNVSHSDVHGTSHGQKITWPAYLQPQLSTDYGTLFVEEPALGKADVDERRTNEASLVSAQEEKTPKAAQDTFEEIKEERISSGTEVDEVPVSADQMKEEPTAVLPSEPETLPTSTDLRATPEDSSVTISIVQVHETFEISESPLPVHSPSTMEEIELQPEPCNCIPTIRPFSWPYFFSSGKPDSESEDDLHEPLLRGQPPDVGTEDLSFQRTSTVVTIDADETHIRVHDVSGAETLDQAVQLAQELGVLDVHQVSTSTPAEGPEYVKSIVYGGLDVTFASLGVVSAAAGGDAKTVTVVAMGLANLVFGFITFCYSILSLYHDKPDVFKETVGKSFRLNGLIASFSFLIFGCLAPLTYGFSFMHSQNTDFKFASTCLISLLAIIILGAGKAYVTSKALIRTVTAIVSAGFIASVSAYFAGDYIAKLLEKYGFDF